MYLMGILSALAVIVLLFKWNIRRALGYALWIDIGFTVLLCLMFAGSFSGMGAAVVGGLVLSIALVVIQHFTGAEKLKVKTTKKRGIPVPYMRWEDV